MIKNLLLVLLIICCCNCSVQELENEPVVESKTFRLVSRSSVSATKNKPLYVAFLKNRYYKLKKGILEDIPPSGISKIQVLKGEKALTKYGDKALNGVIEIEYKPEFHKQLLEKDLEELALKI